MPLSVSYIFILLSVVNLFSFPFVVVVLEWRRTHRGLAGLDIRG